MSSSGQHHFLVTRPDGEVIHTTADRLQGAVAKALGYGTDPGIARVRSGKCPQGWAFVIGCQTYYARQATKAECERETATRV